MAAIQQQLATLTTAQPLASQSTSTRAKQTAKSFKNQKSLNFTASSPKPGFCFRCGEDGHIKPQCENSPNPVLVSAKRKQFNEKKQRWQNQTSHTEHLN